MPLLPLNLQSQRLRLLFSILLLLVSGALILAHFKRAPSEAATVVQNPQGQVQAELITLTPTGFEPSELTRPKGSFLFAIDNRSGLDEVEFYLERETGGRVNVPLSRRGKLAWREIADAGNANGQRVRRRINNQETWQIYGIDGELVAEYAANAAVGTPQKEYGYRDGQLLITAEPAAPPPISGLVAQWKFDENSGANTADSSGNGHTGTLTNGPTWTAGQVNAAVSFDGVQTFTGIQVHIKL